MALTIMAQNNFLFIPIPFKLVSEIFKCSSTDRHSMGSLFDDKNFQNNKRRCLGKTLGRVAEFFGPRYSGEQRERRSAFTDGQITEF